MSYLAVILVSFVGGLTFDVTVNALQTWYEPVYESAFWTPRDKDTPALRALAIEEKEIARLLREQDFDDDGESR